MHVAPGVGVLQVLAALVVLPRRGVGVFLLLIHPAGGDAVAEHLCHVFFGHLAPADVHAAVLSQTVVDPVLKVVEVAALVVQPRQADAVGDALGVVGTAVALIVLHAAPELGGAVLAQVVGQALPDQTKLPAIVPHQTAMGVDGVQMVKKMHGAASFELVWQ